VIAPARDGFSCLPTAGAFWYIYHLDAIAVNADIYIYVKIFSDRHVIIYCDRKEKGGSVNELSS
jgi:hypothetical protein